MVRVDELYAMVAVLALALLHRSMVVASVHQAVGSQGHRRLNTTRNMNCANQNKFPSCCPEVEQVVLDFQANPSATNAEDLPPQECIQDEHITKNVQWTAPAPQTVQSFSFSDSLGSCCGGYADQNERSLVAELDLKSLRPITRVVVNLTLVEERRECCDRCSCWGDPHCRPFAGAPSQAIRTFMACETALLTQSRDLADRPMLKATEEESPHKTTTTTTMTTTTPTTTPTNRDDHQQTEPNKRTMDMMTPIPGIESTGIKCSSRVEVSSAARQRCLGNVAEYEFNRGRCRWLPDPEELGDAYSVNNNGGPCVPQKGADVKMKMFSRDFDTVIEARRRLLDGSLMLSREAQRNLQNRPTGYVVELVVGERGATEQFNLILKGVNANPASIEGESILINVKEDCAYVSNLAGEAFPLKAGANALLAVVETPDFTLTRVLSVNSARVPQDRTLDLIWILTDRTATGGGTTIKVTCNGATDRHTQQGTKVVFRDFLRQLDADIAKEVSDTRVRIQTWPSCVATCEGVQGSSHVQQTVLSLWPIPVVGHPSCCSRCTPEMWSCCEELTAIRHICIFGFLDAYILKFQHRCLALESILKRRWIACTRTWASFQFHCREAQPVMVPDRSRHAYLNLRSSIRRYLSPPPVDRLLVANLSTAVATASQENSQSIKARMCSLCFYVCNSVLS
jgi:hypothetical protein